MIKSRLFLSMITICICMMSFASQTSHAETTNTASFELTTDTLTIAIGQEVEVNIYGKNVSDLYAYEVNVEYDIHRLKFKSVKLSNDGFSVGPVNKGNTLVFGHTKMGNKKGENGNIKLGTMTFIVLDDGYTKLSLKEVTVVDSKLNSVLVVGNKHLTLGEGEYEGVKDMLGHWAEEQVQQAFTRGIVKGYEDGTFRPNKPVTRAEFVDMLINALKISPNPDTDVSTFFHDDIPNWAKSSIVAAVENGIINGYEDQTFRANRHLTRAEMTAIVVSAAKLNLSSHGVSVFEDINLAPKWSQPYIITAFEHDLVNGRDPRHFAPNENTTRAEAIVLIFNLMNR